jgi:hypothetical protein
MLVQSSEIAGRTESLNLPRDWASKSYQAICESGEWVDFEVDPVVVGPVEYERLLVPDGLEAFRTRTPTAWARRGPRQPDTVRQRNPDSEHDNYDGTRRHPCARGEDVHPVGVVRPPRLQSLLGVVEDILSSTKDSVIAIVPKARGTDPTEGSPHVLVGQGWASPDPNRGNGAIRATAHLESLSVAPLVTDTTHLVSARGV